VATVRHLYPRALDGSPQLADLSARTFELCEFLTDALGIERWEGRFAHRVGLHRSCHGLRELRLGRASERVEPPFDKVERLLASLVGISLAPLGRADECCGFGGSFAVEEEAVSCAMGRDRLDDHERGSAEIVTSVDGSCLLHLSGLIRREGRPLEVMHVAEILARSATP
jgi:L-lactate dehydrogenase complex protein LldE